jgi:hypothetical protein
MARRSPTFSLAAARPSPAHSFRFVIARPSRQRGRGNLWRLVEIRAQHVPADAKPIERRRWPQGDVKGCFATLRGTRMTSGWWAGKDRVANARPANRPRKRLELGKNREIAHTAYQFSDFAPFSVVFPPSTCYFCARTIATPAREGGPVCVPRMTSRRSSPP